LARSPALVAVESSENCLAYGFGVKQGEIRGNRGFDLQFEPRNPFSPARKELSVSGLVHLSGRVYDPLLAWFTSANTITENPFSTQG
jgi:hypothetical protein